MENKLIYRAVDIFDHVWLEYKSLSKFNKEFTKLKEELRMRESFFRVVTLKI